MKLKLLTVAVAALVLPMSVSAESPAVAEVPAEKAADTVDSLAEEVLNKLNDMVVILESVEDDASADKAAKDLDKIGDDMLAISKRLSKLEKPDADKKAELEKKFVVKMEEFGGRVGKVMQGLMEKPGLAQKLANAMQQVGGKMEEAGEVFDAYFDGEGDAAEG